MYIQEDVDIKRWHQEQESIGELMDVVAPSKPAARRLSTYGLHEHAYGRHERAPSHHPMNDKSGEDRLCTKT